MKRLVNHGVDRVVVMAFEWDDGKDAANRAKHGVSLADAVRLDWQIGIDVVDLRVIYGELRVVRFAMLDGRLHVCVYTQRNDRRRIISLRKANRREIRDHGTAQNQTSD